MGTAMYNINEHSTHIPPKGKIIIYWLGGAGFIVKYSDGFTICIDPYLSDSVERICGFKRLHSAPIKADNVFFDVLFITHEHPDHLDEDSFDALMNNNARCQIYAPICCDVFLKSKKRAYIMVKPGDDLSAEDLSIKVTKADHGELSPHAVGYLFEKANHRIWLTGDTAFNEEVLKPVVDMQPDIVLPCINGAYGNMDEQQAAMLIAKCNSLYAIPMHFGLFTEHGGDAVKFKTLVRQLSPKTKIHILAPGEGIEL